MSKNYHIGYGKPPKHGQFKKGQSGNPKGRVDGAKSLKTVLQDELSQQISITEDGQQRKITKMEALAKRLVAKALQGEPRALAELLKQVNIHLPNKEQGDEQNLPATKEDAALISSFIKRAIDEAVEEDGDE